MPWCFYTAELRRRLFSLRSDQFCVDLRLCNKVRAVKAGEASPITAGMKVAPVAADVECPPTSHRANEYVVDVAHGACDFISAVDTPVRLGNERLVPHAQLRIRRPISAKPTSLHLRRARAGAGTSRFGRRGAELKDWVAGIRDGRSYCTDGYTHLFDFTVNDLGSASGPTAMKMPAPVT